MPGPGRNERCPCGSGRKVKRCCGQHKGPSEDQVAQAYLKAQRQAAILALTRHHDHDEFADLFQAAFELPSRYDELIVDLPRLAHPDLEPLRWEIERDCLREDSPALGPAVAVIDGPVVRARFARSILRLRDEEDLDSCVATAALVDLGAPDSLLIEASLIHALMIDTGRATRASGLLVAR